MPTDSNTITLLFKSRYGVSDTETTRKYYEETVPSKQVVLNSQIYANDIPLSNPLSSSFSDPADTISGVVQVKKNIALSAVAGTTNAFYSSILIDSIPHNYDSIGGTYNYKLTKNDGITIIPFGSGDWLIDNAGGVLRFYGSLPSGVSSGSPPRISFFKYVGAKGVSAGSVISVVNVGTSGLGIFRDLTASGATANFYNLFSLSPGLTITLDGAGNKLDFTLVASSIDHNSLGNLTTSDAHTQYVKKDGRTGGQTIYGGTSVGDNINIESTSNTSKGAIVLKDRIRIGPSGVNTGIISGKKILTSTGNQTVCTVIMNGVAKQYVTLKVTMSAWDVSLDVIENYIVTILVQNGPVNVTHTNIVDTSISPNFTNVDGIGNNSFYIRYNGEIGDVIVSSLEWIVNGPNHANDIISVTF